MRPQLVISTTSHPIIKRISKNETQHIMPPQIISYYIKSYLIMSENPFDVFKEEMDNEEVYLRVNAMHRVRIVATLLG